MAAAVVADQAEMLGERLDLLVPHMQIGAERVRQHQHRRALRPFDLDMNAATVIDFDVGHCYLLPGSSLRGAKDEAIQLGAAELDCFAEPVIGPATSGRTRWLAMTL